MIWEVLLDISQQWSLPVLKDLVAYLAGVAGFEEPSASIEDYTEVVSMTRFVAWIWVLYQWAPRSSCNVGCRGALSDHG